MTLARTRRQASVTLLLAGTVLAGPALLGVPPAAASAEPLADNAVTVTVLDVTPSTPGYTATPAPLKITLSLMNTTGRTLYSTEINAQREAPITNTDSLHDLISHPRQVDPSSLSEMHRLVLAHPLAAHQSGTVVFSSTTSRLSDGSSDICLCNPGVYPLDFTVQASDTADGVPTKVGFGQTFLPSFADDPQPVQLSWLWPLIDRPHRSTNDSAFIDDDLRAAIGAGGRLSRALSVAERLAGKVRLTLVVDPELVDELTVMTEGYTVPGVDGRPVPGTGGAAAAGWLRRLRAVLPFHEVHRTPYADPDVVAFTSRGVPWQMGAFDVAQQRRVDAVLGSATARPDLAWPVDGATSQQALATVVRRGVTTVVLAPSALSRGSQDPPVPDALAPLSAPLGASGVVAAVTDADVQPQLGPLLAVGGAGTAQLPRLVAELALRAVAEPDRRHYVVVAPDRHLDVDPDVAARVIRDTAATRWSTGLTLRQAVTRVTPVDHGVPVANAGSPGPSMLLDAAAGAAQFRTSFSSALSEPAAEVLFAGLPANIQRAGSSSWTTAPRDAARYAAALNARVAGWQRAVQIQPPANRSYTLASTSAPLFVTVVNTLPVPVTVRVALITVNGLVGFRADDVGPQTIPAGQKAPLRIPVHVQRAGRFQLVATVTTPSGSPLGNTVTLGINSTALGAVGVVITAVAAAVLIIALLVRGTRRVRRRRAPTGAPGPMADRAGSLTGGAGP